MSPVRNLRVRPDQLYIASGWSTLITDVRGRITDADPYGFFARNTRVLSEEIVTVDGREPLAFSAANVHGHAQLCYAALGDGETLPSRAAYLLTERFLGEGLWTRLTVVSYADAPLTMRLGVLLDADFADINEAENRDRRQCAPVDTRWHPERRELRVTYRHERLDVAVAIEVRTVHPVGYADRTVTVDLVVPARGDARVDFLVEPVFDGERLGAPSPEFAQPGDPAARARAVLAGEFARLRSTNVTVAGAWQSAIDDLTVLPLGEPPGPAAPMAGLPIYQEIFGRDTMTASWQALLAGPTMLRDSLRLNAAHIGRRVDDWRDEQPGKPLHEARHGPVSALGLDPFTAYYGDWATGPDFLSFLGQYFAWTGDRDTLRELLPAARRVLDWIECHGDPDRDGFLEYRSRSPAGLKNQGWKDSATAIVDEWGRVVADPIATSELQGYWYAALRHAALVFAAVGEPRRAAALVARAGALRRRFHRAYWLPERRCHAMALGPDKRPVRSTNSNDGHLLATGIVPARIAPMVADRLFAPDMFSGWGIRTLSADHPAYNPFSYHRGSVWPVEAGTIALGLARYGCWSQLHRLAEGAFAASALFEGHRLPEVLSGLPRDAHPHPGVYPNSCSPQAWSASAVVAIVQALLTFRPAAPLRTVFVDPHLPDWLPDLALEGVRVGDATFDLEVRRRRGRRTSVRTRGDRITVIRRPTLQSLLAGRAAVTRR
ncbi:Glycogen debranching enzyme (alpha-1,6-glucosidase) [Micromonospora pattaloongensis]|uniref:Glycogen debranching enzyme (Alpha-1,6-glucosidase) n=1 Tax=Micromonospora pattaloongensis TaxID=405436 RepID=A0A1H3QSN3_9ACTN|nr:glycogen debranching N-terminal domain-containing protein [Micromonospora pattaloongensis]SDZ16437.1 Glycogen debranching enzyme (alpha-1,6-glucosidase) [Micromonospora pattaloongensis]